MRSSKRLAVAALAVIVCAAPATVSRAAPAAPAIHVFSCQVMSGILLPRKDDVGLLVRFRNDSPSALTSIVWRGKYGKGFVDFVDDGTFARDLRIDNFVLAEQGSTHFNWGGFAFDAVAVAAHTLPSSGLMTTNIVLPPFVSLPNPENCSVIRATFDTGETWVNPDAAQQLALLTAPTPIPVPSATASGAQAELPEPIAFSRCTLWVTPRPLVEVTFRNVWTRPADRIVVRAPFGTSAIDFVDQGTFAPDTVVKHMLKKPVQDELRDQSYISLDDPRDCAIVSAHFADGSTWQNPAIGATPAPLPTPVADSIRIGHQKLNWAPRHGFATPAPSASDVPAATPIPSAT